MTDFDEIWHSDIYLKIQHGGGRRVENHKNRDIFATV